MALANKRSTQEPQLGSIYDNMHSGYDDDEPSRSLALFGYKGDHPTLFDREEGGPTLRFDANDSSSGTSVLGAMSYPVQEANSGMSFKGGSDYWAYSAGSGSSSSSSSSVLSFEQAGGGGRLAHAGDPNRDDDDECALWMDAMDPNNCQQGAMRFGFVHGSSSSLDGLQESFEHERVPQKRAYPGGEVQAAKKHCGATRKSKAKPAPTKDPQSVAAKVRRERISERLKVLQDLVPNGTKVDLVTMLEKAINYVKFLQLQVKVLATDEFWPAQGGKAPELSQVKEAFDAILSQRDSTPKQ